MVGGPTANVARRQPRRRNVIFARAGPKRRRGKMRIQGICRDVTSSVRAGKR